MINQWEAVLKAIGQATRLKIIFLLARGEHCVCELERILSVSQPAISQHMRVLKAAGLVSERREGQWIFYSLNATALKDVFSAMLLALDDPAQQAGGMDAEWRIEAQLMDDPLVPHRTCCLPRPKEDARCP